MKIISLEKIGKPFVGIVEKEDAYVTFLFSSENGYKEERVYPKSDFQSYEHFVAMIDNFKSYNCCVMPIEIDSISEYELSRAYKIIQSL